MRDPQHAIEALYATGHWLLSQERCTDAASVFRAMSVAAPTDERAWLALGTCHERIGQLRIAAELYRIGGMVAPPAIRCGIALGRVLRTLGFADEADAAFDEARQAAEEHDDDGLARLAAAEGATP